MDVHNFEHLSCEIGPDRFPASAPFVKGSLAGLKIAAWFLSPAASEPVGRASSLLEHVNENRHFSEARPVSRNGLVF